MKIKEASRQPSEEETVKHYPIEDDRWKSLAFFDSANESKMASDKKTHLLIV